MSEYIKIAIGSIGTTFIAIVVGAFALGGEWKQWVEIRDNHMHPIKGDVVPSGTITFYNAGECADGWSKVDLARGRVLIGAGTYNSDEDADGINQAFTYNTGKYGGNINYSLSVKQMPKHQHGTSWGEASRGNYGYRGGPRNNFGSASSDFDNYEFLSQPVGAGEPFDNRMPYIAYTVCKKD